MNFHLSAVDELLRRQGDEPSIGLILCKGKGKTTVEYALRDTNKPIDYRILFKARCRRLKTWLTLSIS